MDESFTDRGPEAARIWRAHTNVAIGHFRTQLKAQRDRCRDLSVTTKDQAMRYAELAVAEARLAATVEMAELLLSAEDFTLLMDTLGLNILRYRG